jgi:23S rRNA G2069 N7-methylase RlmK/C1962 C5-methylase RlmI
MTSLGENSWMAKKYGVLKGNWKQMLKDGFDECMRVLKPNGTLIFKWNEQDIPVSEILKVISYTPMYGHKSGKLQKTHWMAFMKEGDFI